MKECRQVPLCRLLRFIAKFGIYTSEVKGCTCCRKLYMESVEKRYPSGCVRGDVVAEQSFLSDTVKILSGTL